MDRTKKIMIIIIIENIKYLQHIIMVEYNKNL